MTGPRVVVCMKVVPRPEEVRVDPVKHTLDRVNARNLINPPDMPALEAALRLKDAHGGEVLLLSMGPPFAEHYLRLGLMLGADRAFLASDRGFAGADTLATTYTLAKAVEKIGRYDLVICGEESSDGATGQVPPGLAEWLDVPQITYALELDYEAETRRLTAKREQRGGWEVVECAPPAVVSIKAGSLETRFLDYERRAWAMREGPVTFWSSADLGADPALIGLAGSPTTPVSLREMSQRERKREMLAGGPAEAARALARRLKPYLKARGSGANGSA